MATIIDALVITLGLDPKGVNTGMQQAKGALDTGVKSIVSDVVKPLSVLLAGAFAGGAIIQRFVDAAELGKLSQQLNTSVEDLQAWQGAAIQAGGSAEGLLAAAKGLRDRTGSRLPITQQLLYAADQLKGLSEVRAMEVGKSWGFDENTIKLLRQGRQAVQELVNQQKEMVAFSKEDVAMIQKMKLGYDGLRNMIFSVSNLVIKLFLPAINWIAEKMQSATGFFPEARRRMGLVSQWISENGPHIQNAFAVIAAVITALWGMARAGLTAILPFLPFIALVGALVLVFDDLVTYINGGESALEDFWALFGTGPELAAAFAAGWEGVKVVLGGLWEILKQLGKALLAIANFNPTALTEAGHAILNIFSDVWNKLNEILGLGEKFEKFMAGVKGLFDKASNALGFGNAPQSPEVAQAFNRMYADPALTVKPAEARAGGTTTVQADTKIDKIEVVTQATDAQGIAKDIDGATRGAMNQNTQLVMGANSGVSQK